MAEKRYYWANPERYREMNRARNRRYRAANYERLIIMDRKHRSAFKKRHPDRNAATQNKRRALQIGAFVKGTEEAIRKIYSRAQELRQWFDVAVDHIIPLSKGGSHSPDNLQIIYQFENAAKNSRLDYKAKVVFA